MPWKRSVDVKEARSMPTKDFGGSSRRRSVVDSWCAIMSSGRQVNSDVEFSLGLSKSEDHVESGL